MVYMIEHKSEREPKLDNETMFLNALQYKQWLEGDNCSIKATSLYKNNSVHGLYGKQSSASLKDYVERAKFFNEIICPIGSVEFTNKILKIQGFNSLTPVRFPLELLALDKYRDFATIISSGIYYKHTGGTLNLGQIKPGLNGLSVRYLIKSATELKVDVNDLYSVGDPRLKDFPKGEYFITVWLGDNAFVSEYRIIASNFNRDRQVLSVRPYIGDTSLVTPDIGIINQFIEDFRDAPPYYSIDVGVTQQGKTVLIEIHNYLCLGSYGYDNGAMFIPMTAQALRWELNKYNK